MTRQVQEPAIWFPAIRAGSGTDVFTERLVQGLRQRGLRAEITWLPQHAEFLPWLVAKPKPPVWANIAHVNSWLPTQFIHPSLPFITTLHGCVHDRALRPYKSSAKALYHRYWIYRIEAQSLQLANRVVAVSHYTKQMASASFNLNHISVIPNAIDLGGQFQPIERDTPHEPFRLVYAGNWSQLKGVDLLATIMKQLGSGFSLHYTADRKGAHTRYPLPFNSHCLGRLRDSSQMSAVYQEADALLLPSRLEGFGLVALEAQACGLPVIATQGSSLPEVIDNGVTGLLCPPDNIQAFADAARLLSNDIPRWQNMRRDARRWVEERFNMDTVIDRYILIYRDVLHKKMEPMRSKQPSRGKRSVVPTSRA